MHVPSITGFYLAILALIYAVLALQVARLRRNNLVLFGDADNRSLRSAIRVHANFIEYVPIITLLVALLEMSGMMIAVPVSWHIGSTPPAAILAFFRKSKATNLSLSLASLSSRMERSCFRCPGRR